MSEQMYEIRLGKNDEGQWAVLFRPWGSPENTPWEVRPFDAISNRFFQRAEKQATPLPSHPEDADNAPPA